MTVPIMKHRSSARLLIPAALALLISLPALAGSSVWRAEKDGSTVYIGGTCHLLRQSDFPLPAEFDYAYERSKVLVFETDIEKMQEAGTQLSLLEKGRYSDGTTLKDVLSEKTYQALEDYCQEAGLPMAMLNQLKPSLAMLTLASLEMVKLGFTPEGVDIHYSRKARKEGKPVQGLEKLDEQIDMLMNMGKGHEDEFVMQSLRDMSRTGEMLGSLVKAWKKGDPSALAKLLTEEVNRDFPEMYQELLVDRNNAWLPKIEALFDSDEVEFVLVGTGHLVGPDGILALLRKRGYRVQTVEAKP